MAENFPIVLEQVVFTKTVVVSLPEHMPVEGRVTSPPENHIEVQPVEGGGRRFALRMRSIYNKEYRPEDPYFIDMEVQVILSVDSTLSDEEALRGVTITGHSVAYGAIRETVLWITGRHPYGPIAFGLSVLKGPGEQRPSDSTQ